MTTTDEKERTASESRQGASALDSPESWVRTREAVADERERLADARDGLAAARDLELEQRAEIARLRDEALRARAEADEVRADRERLLAQIRESNERLVIATVHADELAEQAEAARAAASDNEERFRSLVTTSAAIVWHADRHGKVRIDADSWRGYTGREPSIGAFDGGWLEAIHPDDRGSTRARWDHAVATATPYRCQHRIQTAGGGYAHVVSRAVPIQKDGAVREWIGMITDVSDRVLIEEARDQFIAILGHDLRNPLSSILGGADLLQLAKLPPPYDSVALRIARSARRMELMIRDVMDFARGRLGGGIPVTPIPCDLGRIGAAVVAELQQAHPSREIQYEALGDLHGTWDEARAEQVLSNLVGNSIAHGMDPIRVSARAEGDDVVTIVHNPGAPIPPEVIPRLFEPFVEGPNIPGSRPRGLGLGLYIASEIVRAHGGAITVSSTPASGTTFEVRWPRTPRPPALAPGHAFET